MDKLIAILSLIGMTVAAMALLTQGQTEMDIERINHQQYCEMIQINKETEGQFGWPDDGRECE